MAGPSQECVVDVLLERHGTTYAVEAGIDVARNTPQPLFQLLCLSLLLSARIRASAAVSAARALSDAGWSTPEKLARSSWEERTKVLNESGYARYDESTSRMLGDTAELVLDRWHGDLRELRDEADRQPDQERRLLEKCKGIGEVGADIFCREAQLAWEELAPFADERALRAADALGLPTDADELRQLVPDDAAFTRLVDALVRVELGDRAAEVLDLAAGPRRRRR